MNILFISDIVEHVISFLNDTYKRIFYITSKIFYKNEYSNLSMSFKDLLRFTSEKCNTEEVIEWSILNGYEYMNDLLTYYAILSMNKHALKLAKNKYAAKTSTWHFDNIYPKIALVGDSKILEWAEANECDWTEEAVYNVIDVDNISGFMWMEDRFNNKNIKKYYNYAVYFNSSKIIKRIEDNYQIV